eukprot:5990002-Amphidinium_carterae.1
MWHHPINYPVPQNCGGMLGSCPYSKAHVPFCVDATYYSHVPPMSSRQEQLWTFMDHRFGGIYGWTTVV